MSRPTQVWVISLLTWLAAALLVEILWGGRLLVEVGVVIGLVAAYTTAGWMILSKLRRIPREERTAWRLIAVSFLMVAVGMVSMAVTSLLSPRVGAFGPMDLLFLAAYGVGVVGIACLPPLQRASSRRRLLLDGSIGAVSIAALMWVVVGEDLYRELSSGPRWDLVVGSAYPILDLASFVVVMLVVLKRHSYRFDPRLLAVGGALVAQAVGDVLYFRAGVGSGFLEADPLYSLHLVAAASLVISALIAERRPSPREFAQRDTPWTALLAPYAAAAALTVVTGARVVMAQELDASLRFLLLATFVVVCLVVIRQLHSIRENRTLVERERETLVSSISHELRTPLTAVVAGLEILGDGMELPEAERHELLMTSRDQARYLSRTVSDLVLAARESPASMALRPVFTDIRWLVDEAVAGMVDRPAHLEIDCPEGLSAEVDPDRLTQLLVNLLDNARRYGGQLCTVTARSGGEGLTLEVHDDGPGVPERYRELIWKRFERGVHRLDGAIPGSGIGLPLVGIIARAHGGSASYVQSELLGGACFRVVLPQRPVRARQIPPVSPRARQISS
ncbi:MAG: sensor histidine kinase [Actinomycetota bacterium]